SAAAASDVYTRPEDRYASGIAGGEVTKTVAFRARSLQLTTHKRDDITDFREDFLEKQRRNEKTAGCLLRMYDVVLEEGCLKEFQMIEPLQDPGEVRGKIWYLYEIMEKETPWCNNQTYADTLNEDAVKAFITKTHERYADVLQEEFGKSVPAIFTDEPHIPGMSLSAHAIEMESIGLPFTEKLPELYMQKCGLDFFQAVPDMVWNRKGEEISQQRYYLYEVCAEQFVSAYCGTIGKWCRDHGILSTGHILGEESLAGQAGAVGEAMRCYREFQLPGIDNLCDFREFSSVKQASGVAHQQGREGVLSELYGVTQWDFDFEGYKLAGDWQAALGVTTRVPHLAWASMAGEAKRDYPAAIGWQSPWYKDFGYIEDHFARVNYCLTRGEPMVRVGMIHPIETMWLYQDAAGRIQGRKEQLETDFKNITEWLLTNGIDFDYIAESALEESGWPEDDDSIDSRNKFVCGKMKYDVILVPDCIHLRYNTFKRLSHFRENGGKILLCGTKPKYTACGEDTQLMTFTDRCQWIPVEKSALLRALEPWREVDIKGADGSRKELYLHQFRREGDARWFFLAQAYRGLQSRQKGVWTRRPLHAPEQIVIEFKGSWLAERYDTLTGEREKLNVGYEKGNTLLQYSLYGDDSLLLHLKPVKDIAESSCADSMSRNILQKGMADTGVVKEFRISRPVGYSTEEPNVLLLDKFQYALEDEDYSEECELLRADNDLRRRLGYPLRMEHVEQPYVRKLPDSREHQVRLKTTIYSRVAAEGCFLALEEPEYYRGTLNGEEICMEPVGHYVDRAIRTVALPKLREGENELVLYLQYGNASNLEWMYLLGEFGVRLSGAYKELMQKPDHLYWGDYTRQGYPFYTGNMVYYFELSCEKETDLSIQIPYYAGAAVKISVDGEPGKMAALLPFQCALKNVKKGSHRIAVTCLGHRYNGFGQLHMIGDDLVWLGPDSWRTENESWAEEYQVRPMGVLSEPVVRESRSLP
ncbi:MAG: hypothetical protein K2K63_11885, partial [Acetatifactor sp.]|nr:hypothetical protein [Acetatifactor sp.]